MRYAQGGGLRAHEQAARERIRMLAAEGFERGEEKRMLAAEGFERGEENTVIAKDLRVSVRSVERWRRDWRAHGRAGLRS
ncbi:helix-turn-helix domain-containing protein, partial [Streptomyces sp. WM6378]|uniref:helix-turn-helix domain-containing protein n=1 Tax=Streptomyces sp. WM6378 TaxID=1415557 RepID=UPI003B6357DF